MNYIGKLTGEDSGGDPTISDRSVATGWAEEDDDYGKADIFLVDDTYGLCCGEDNAGTDAVWAEWNGSAWSAGAAITDAAELNGVWATADDNAWIVGRDDSGNAAIWKWNDVAIAKVKTVTGGRFRAIHGIAGSRYFAVGEDASGPIVYYSDNAGATWADLSYGGHSSEDLSCCFSYAADKVVVGSRADSVSKPEVQYHDGSSWTALARCDSVDYFVYDIWATGPSKIFAVGVRAESVMIDDEWVNKQSGVVWEYNGVAWSRSLMLSWSWFMGICEFDDKLWVVGHNQDDYRLPEDQAFVYYTDDWGSSWSTETVDSGVLNGEKISVVEDSGGGGGGDPGGPTVIDGGGPLGGLMPRQRGSNNAARATLLGPSNGRGGLPIPYNAKLFAAIAARKK